MRFLKRILLGLAVLFAITQFVSCEDVTEDWLTELEDAIFEQINVVREENNSPALTWNEELASFARDHSEDMGVRGYFDHTTPEGKTFAERIADSGIEYEAAGENLYFRSGDASTVPLDDLAVSVVQAWWDSQGHREMMINEAFDQGGVGCYQSDAGLYVTFNAIKTP
jgi:uncharacterized protein YkwD